MPGGRTRRWTLATAGSVTLAATLAGCRGDAGTETPTPLPAFAITEFAFARAEPNSFGNYERQPDATYSAEDVVWIYQDVVGFETEDAGEDERRVEITEDLLVEAPTGETALDERFEFTEEVRADARDQFYLTNELTFPGGVPTGEYAVEVTLTDEIGGSTTGRTERFTLE